MCTSAGVDNTPLYISIRDSLDTRNLQCNHAICFDAGPCHIIHNAAQKASNAFIECFDDQALQDKTALNPDRVAELLWRLETCLSSIYFSYGGAVYEQQEGKAMGLPVSAAVANHYMRVL